MSDMTPEEFMEIFPYYDKLAKFGITQDEVRAAVKCLVRELGRPPKHCEIIAWLKAYMEWRELSKASRGGEVVLRVEITKHGIKVGRIAQAIDDIFAARGGE